MGTHDNRTLSFRHNGRDLGQAYVGYSLPHGEYRLAISMSRGSVDVGMRHNGVISGVTQELKDLMEKAKRDLEETKKDLEETKKDLEEKEEACGDLHRLRERYEKENFVKFSESELMDMMEQNASRSKKIAAQLKERQTCPICMDAKRTHCMAPCGHTYCGACIDRMPTCGICREVKQGKVQLRF